MVRMKLRGMLGHRKRGGSVNSRGDTFGGMAVVTVNSGL